IRIKTYSGTVGGGMSHVSTSSSRTTLGSNGIYRKKVVFMGSAKRFQELVQVERERQAARWGEPYRHPDAWVRILGEEFGEVCKAVQHGDVNNLIEELVQVAAVAQAFFEQIDAEMRSARR